MLLLAVMLYLHSVVKGKRVHGKHGMYALRRLLFFFYRKLSQYPPVIGEDDQSILEKFVVTMHDRFSATDSTDVARLELFARKQRSYDSILPTQAALIQHIKRAAYQAGYIWGQATICQMETNSPADWGWKKQDDMWQIFWTALLPIAQSC
jgi:hypothetical protein